MIEFIQVTQKHEKYWTQRYLLFPPYKFPSFLKILFVFGCAGSSLLHRLFSSCGKQGLCSSCGVQAPHCSGFSCRGARALGAQASVVAAPGLQSTGPKGQHIGLVAPQHVGSSRLRDGTHVSGTSRWILYHGATREAPYFLLNLLALVLHPTHHVDLTPRPQLIRLWTII